MKLTIAPKGDKGRSFSAELLACAQADALWEGGGTTTDTIRPVWMVLAGSELELRAFMANLMTGKVAIVDNRDRAYDALRGNKYEILRSAGYAHHTVKLGGGAVTTLYLPDLVCIDPGMVDPDYIRFIVIPAMAWVTAQSFDLIEARAIVERLAGMSWDITDTDLHNTLAEGVLFLAYLDRRCRYPIPFSPALGAWLMMVCEQKRVLHRPAPQCSYHHKYHVFGAKNAQSHPGFAFGAKHEDLSEILSSEIPRWFSALDGVAWDQLERWMDSLGGMTHGS